MGTHYREQGPSPIVVGYTYSNYPINSVYFKHSMSVLVEYNEATGMCKLHTIDAWRGRHGYNVFFKSASELSHCHVIHREPNLKRLCKLTTDSGMI